MNGELAPREVVMVFAHAIAKLGPLTRTVGGTIGFSISGDRGGRWIVDLDSDGGVWSEWTDLERAPATTIDSGALAFADLILKQTLAPEIEVRGDRTKLGKLAELIRSGGSMLTQRAKSQQPPRPKGRRRKRR